MNSTVNNSSTKNGANTILEISQLQVALPTTRGTVYAVRNVSFCITQGEMLAIVGESGCGKSVTAKAIANLLPSTANIQASTALFKQQALLTGQYQRGIAMIFQNPMATFNPVLTIGYQIAEPLRLLHGYNRHDAERETVRLLERMKISDAKKKIHRYAHEFSGGMLQRAAIAMALACKPQLLIADEPTTALDVSTQAEVMHLLAELRHEQHLALLFITHDLGLVSQYADRIAVMYAGEIIETANTHKVLATPAHPYTRALLAALPTMHSGQRLLALDGAPPDLRFPPAGCAFADRCSNASEICTTAPPLMQDQHAVRCWLNNGGSHE